MQDKERTQKGKKVVEVIANVITVIFCILLLTILVVNIVVFVKSVRGSDEAPTFMGITPLIVESGSMEPEIKIGDLIFIRKSNPEEFTAGTDGTVIAFKNDGNIVTHRIADIKKDTEGGSSYITKGDANNVEDVFPVHADSLIGAYVFRIPKLGAAAAYTQTPVGMAVCIAVPLAVYILVILLRKNKQLRRQMDEFQGELMK